MFLNYAPQACFSLLFIFTWHYILHTVKQVIDLMTNSSASTQIINISQTVDISIKLSHLFTQH